MKKMLIACTAGVLFAMALGTTAFASPLKNYDAGKIAIDAGLNIPTSMESDRFGLDESNSAYFGGTLGLGSNMALNYKWNQYDYKHGNTDAHQLNLMYKVLPGISAYAGYLNADTDSDFGGRSQDSAQIGLQASYDIPAFCTVWGNIGVGTNNSGYEIGLSKPIVNNVELNLSYYDQKFDDAMGDNNDLKAKGVNMGVTVKF